MITIRPNNRNPGLSPNKATPPIAPTPNKPTPKGTRKENALKKAEEKTKQKEGHKILKEDALIKAQEKRIAASIKAQQKKKSTNILKRLKEKLGSKRIQEKKS